MITRRVIYTLEARADLDWIYRTVARSAGKQIAARYLNRIELFCNGLSNASERGTIRDDLRPNLRIIGFERRIAVAFEVREKTVRIARLLYGGADWPGPP